MRRVLVAFRSLLSELFTLNNDMQDEKVIVENIKKDVSFKGTNVWTLVFAIFIASIGLNVNSTAVIIGAMLISPLMGPIIGIGFSIGTYDFELLKKSIINILTAAFISVVTSTLYFTITPLHDASSELLARTNPSLWDVFIAFFGGLAGIVAGTRKEKSNVIPGVAIATALMPPLCTAGYGIATGKWIYFFGAFYLFFINCLFICLAAFLIVKRLKFHRKALASAELEKKVARYIIIIVSLTVLPSIYLAYRIVQRSIFESNADRFVKNEFRFSRTQVITKNFVFEGKERSIELLLIGQPLTDALLDTIKKTMPAYSLEHVDLIVRQGLDAKEKIDISAIKASVLEDVYALQAKSKADEQISELNDLPFKIKDELKLLYPSLQNYSLSRSVIIHTDTVNKNDTVFLFVGKFRPPLSAKEKKKFNAWLNMKVDKDTVISVYE